MPPPRTLARTCWHGVRLCSRGVAAMLHWTAWIGLGAVLIFQLYVLAAQQLTLPGFVSRRLTEWVASTGFRVEFGAAHFDPLGRILLEDVRLAPGTIDRPVLTATSIYLQVDPWKLLAGEVDWKSAELSGVDLLIPPLLSPTGTETVIVRNLHARLRPGRAGRDLVLDGVDARVGPVQIDLRGTVARPAAGAAPLQLDQLGAAYARLVRQVGPWLPRLEALGPSQLEIVLTADPVALAVADVRFTTEQLDLSPFTAASPLGPTLAEGIELHTRGSLIARGPRPLDLRVTAARVDAGSRGSAERVTAELRGSFDPTIRRLHPESLVIETGSLATQGLPLSPVVARFRDGGELGVSFDALLAYAGTPWSAAGLIDPNDRRGTISARGKVPYPLLQWASARSGVPLDRQLTYDDAPAIDVTLRLGPGGRPESAEGTLVSGPAIARNVSLEAASARVAWSGRMLVADDIVLLTPNSRATGRYEMETDTRRFRFLLDGTLRPADIDGWFRDWWPRFWSTFLFPSAPPRASVEVAGRWGAPLETGVFVAAEGENVELRGVALDGVATRLFVRPGRVDVTHFRARSGEHSAQGSFLRVAEAGGNRLSELEFDVVSDLSPEQSVGLAGPEIRAAIEPFVFERQPQVRAAGRIDGPGSPVGEHRRIQVQLRSQGAVTFFDFPLRDLAFTARVDDNDILLDQATAKFAGGAVEAHAQLEDVTGSQRLGFDAVLTGAELGRSIQTIEEYSAARAGRPASPESRFQQKIAAGRLDLALSAEGTARDIYSFNGAGNAQISGAELGEINLLGILSSLLRSTLLNYSTLQLDRAQANFALRGRQLAFSEVKITGPRAALEARGDYYLDTRALDFTTKVYPFEESRGLLGSAVGAVLTPFSQFLEVKLTGQLASPDWAFVLGPTNLLRSILGTGSAATAPAENALGTPAATAGAQPAPGAPSPAP